MRSIEPGIQKLPHEIPGSCLRMPRNDDGDLLLLPVIRQHLLAGLGELAAILLQAGQHDLITFLHVRPAKPRDIARAGIMALLLLSRSR